MRVDRWELAVSVVGLVFASVFLFSNVWGLGVALVCVDALWLLTRLEIVEKQSGPGRYATLRGRLGAVRLLFIVGIYAAVIYGLFIVRHDLSGRARAALIADFGLAGLAFMLLGELERSGDDMLNWLVGARAERKVGLPLNQFADRGWLVVHGYKKDRGGDIDHVLCGPNGAFIVETKSYGFRRRDVRQTALNAWWLRQKLGVPWVTGVLCVDEDRPPEHRDRIWVVSHRDLIGWLEAQRNQPVDPDEARMTLLLPPTRNQILP
jgi:Nuclease-related domain